MRSYDKIDFGRIQTVHAITVCPIYFKAISAWFQIWIHTPWFASADGIPVILKPLQAVAESGKGRVTVVKRGKLKSQSIAVMSKDD